MQLEISATEPLTVSLIDVNLDELNDCCAVLTLEKENTGIPRDFRVGYVNAAACQSSGVSRHLFLGALASAVLPALCREPLFQQLCEVAQTGRPCYRSALDVSNGASGEAPQFWDLQAFEHNGGIIILWEDVSERETTRQALRLARENADRGILEHLRVREAWLTQLGNSIPHIVWCASRTGAWEWVSGQWEEFTGLQFEAAAGLNWLQMLHPDDAEHTRSTLFRFAEPQPYRNEFRMRGQDGDYRWFLCRGNPVLDQQGQVLRWFGTCTDIEEQKQIEQALRESEERYQFAAKATNDIVWDWDLRKKFITRNEAAERLFGVVQSGPARAEVQHWKEHIHPDDLPRILMAQEEAIREGRDHWILEYRARMRDGAYAEILDRAFIVRDEHRVPIRITGALTDLTAINQALRTQARFYEILENTPDLVATADIDGVGLYFNRAARELFGLPHDVSPRTYSLEELVPDWAANVILSEGIPAALEHGHWQGNTAVISAAGEEIPVSQVILAHCNEAGVCEYLSTIARDMREQKKYERKLREREQALLRSISELETVYNASPVGLCLIDPQLRFLRVNRTLAAINEAPVREHIGKTLREVQPMMADQVEHLYRQVIETRAPLANHELYVSATEQFCGERWWLLNLYPVLLNAGHLLGVSALVQDITHIKQAEASIRDSEALFRNMFENAAVGIAHVDDRGAWVRVNDKLCEIVGYSRDEMLATTFQKITHPEDLDRDLALFHRMKRGEIPTYSLRKRYYHKSGRVVWVNLTCSIQRVPGANEQLCTAIVEDITAQVGVEEAIHRLNETLEQRVAERTAAAEENAAQLRRLAAELTTAEQRERRRIATTLHDHLQQILVAAKMSAEQAARRNVPAETAARIASVSDLISEAIQASRNLTVELSPPVLHDRGLGAALVWLGRHMLEQHNLHVTVEADEQAQPIDEDIQTFLFQAVRELLFNVTKHSGSLIARLYMRRLQENQLQILVEDDGDGCEVALMMKRASEEEKGGFGLFNIQQRLTVYGGSFHVDSKRGGGCRITLESPLTVLPQKKRKTATEKRQKLRREKHGIPEGHSRKIRVLIADDHKILREGLAELLKAETDLEIVGEASDGARAVALTRQLLPDVVVMDVSMPELDGIEATRRITSELPDIRIIALSMHEKEDMAQAMISAGAAAYLTKGGPAESLLRAIRGE